MIISVHLRKCAGTTFKAAIQKQYGRSVLLDYGDEVGSSWPSSVRKRRLTRKQALIDADKIVQNYRIIHGHFYPDKYDHLDCKKKFITFMRDPVERVVSNYLYIKRNADRINRDSFVVNRLGFSLEEFARYDDNRNYQSKSLQSWDLSEYDFVGIAEDYQASIEALNAEFGLELEVGKSLNVNESRGADYELTPRQRDLIRACNQDDLTLYDMAVERRAAG